jgi:predicted PurR-regulated permease PerM
MQVDWIRLQRILVCLALIFALVIGFGWALVHISHAIVLFSMAIVLALVLLPVVEWVEGHNVRHRLAVLVTYISFGLVALGVTLLLIGPVWSRCSNSQLTCPTTWH